MIKVSFRLIFIALMLFKQKESIILTEKTVSNKDRTLAIVATEVMNRIREIAKSSEAVKESGVEIHYDDSKCDAYNPQIPDRKVVICIKSISSDDNSIEVSFHSPATSFSFSASNIDIIDESSDIKINPYVEEFFGTLKEQVFDAGQKEKFIRDGFLVGANDIGAENVQLTNNKIEYTYKDKKDKIDYSIQDDLLTMHADYSDDTINLNIPTIKFIKFEASKLIKHVIRHESTMKGFFMSEGATAAKSIKTATCADMIGENSAVFNWFKKRLENDKIEVTSAENAVTISKDGKVVKGTCQETSIHDFNMIQIKIDYSDISPQISPQIQTFLSKSLYDTVAIAESYYDDVGTFIIRVLSDSNHDEDFDASENIN